MPNALSHQVGAAAIIGAIIYQQESTSDEYTLAPVMGAVLAALSTKLPDILEPATSPNHRQFFHGIAFGALVAYGLYKLYKWDPETTSGRIMRFVLLVAGASYLVHLAMDSCTKRSLPLVGKM